MQNVAKKAVHLQVPALEGNKKCSFCLFPTFYFSTNFLDLVFVVCLCIQLVDLQCHKIALISKILVTLQLIRQLQVVNLLFKNVILVSFS